MKVHEFITKLDETRYGRRVSEDTKPVAPAPSHAPTSTAQWKTKSSGKSDDEGEHTGPSGDAIKKKETSMPTPIAPKPSHAPTSTAQWKTDSGVKSDDQGEKISREAIKEAVRQLIDSDEPLDYAELLGEGAHKPGCQCGFCMNKGKMGKKKEEEDEGGGGLEPKNESYATAPPARQAPPMPIKRRLGEMPGRRLGFRSPMRPPPKAAINPYQPAMEGRSAGKNAPKSIQEQADALLEAPGQ